MIDFKRPRKTDTDADKVIRMWVDGSMSKEIATQLGLGGSIRQSSAENRCRSGSERH